MFSLSLLGLNQNFFTICNNDGIFVVLVLNLLRKIYIAPLRQFTASLGAQKWNFGEKTFETNITF